MCSKKDQGGERHRDRAKLLIRAGAKPSLSFPTLGHPAITLAHNKKVVHILVELTLWFVLTAKG